MAERIIRGEATTVDLGNVSPLLLPWSMDPFGALRSPLSVEAMRLSAELAGCTYTMAVDRWMQAGWRDVTIQVDGGLSRIHRDASWLKNRWQLHQARAKIRQRNPIGQVMGALRQKDSSDTGKALVMLHPAPDGRYVVAISFMGTGGRFYDWFSNFRMTSEQGMHRGFLQLTRQFENNEMDIRFPETARELGLETLTLRQILQEARHPGSRFVLWLSGHSQGAALMQIYAMLKIQEDGVLPGNMLGYGFASPSVLSGTAAADPSAYPLYHILNSDDLVPRMGAMVHLGLCLTYPADDALRMKCYALPQDAASARLRQAVAPVVRRMTDTPSCMEIAAGFLLVLSNRSVEDMLDVLSILEVRLPLRPLLNAADSRVDKLIRLIIRRLEAAYRSITGRAMDRARMAQAADQIEEIVGRIGLRRFADTLMQLMTAPHGIRVRRGITEPYVYIVLQDAEKLEPWVWVSGERPWRRHAAMQLGAGGMGGLVCRRRKIPERRKPRIPRRHAPHPRCDTRHHVPVLQPDGVRPGERMIRHE